MSGDDLEQMHVQAREILLSSIDKIEYERIKKESFRAFAGNTDLYDPEIDFIRNIIEGAKRVMKDIFSTYGLGQAYKDGDHYKVDRAFLEYVLGHDIEEELNILARMMAVADGYNAMMHHKFDAEKMIFRHLGEAELANIVYTGMFLPNPVLRPADRSAVIGDEKYFTFSTVHPNIYKKPEEIPVYIGLEMRHARSLQIMEATWIPRRVKTLRHGQWIRPYDLCQQELRAPPGQQVPLSLSVYIRRRQRISPVLLERACSVWKLCRTIFDVLLHPFWVIFLDRFGGLFVFKGQKRGLIIVDVQ